MKISAVTAPGETGVLDVETPSAGPRDVLVKMRACGICGSDALYISLGGLREDHIPLGHEPADIYFDAAGAPEVIDTALTIAKRGARLGVVAVHKQPVPVDFMNVMSNEITIVGSMGYPTEIFEVTRDIVANWEKYAVIVSHTIPFENVEEALRLAATPGAADKVVVTFD